MLEKRVLWVCKLHANICPLLPVRQIIIEWHKVRETISFTIKQWIVLWGCQALLNRENTTLPTMIVADLP